MLVYLCVNSLSVHNVNISQQCNDAAEEVSVCRGGSGLLLGAWAVGGDVMADTIIAIRFHSCFNTSQDFVYPNGVAYPIGGAGQERYVVIEMHYDNPSLQSGLTLHHLFE